MEIEKLTLPQLMLLWGSLDGERNRVAELIQEQVLQLKATQNVGDVRATFGKGKGSYDYQGIAEEMKVDDMLIAKHTSKATTLDWKALCDQLERDLKPEAKRIFYAIKGGHFTPGKEQVRISIIKAKPATEPKQT